MSEPLDLNALAKLVEKYRIDLSWFEIQDERSTGTLFVGSMPEAGSIARVDYVYRDDGVALITLLSALPALIDLAREALSMRAWEEQVIANQRKALEDGTIPNYFKGSK